MKKILMISTIVFVLIIGVGAVWAGSSTLGTGGGTNPIEGGGSTGTAQVIFNDGTQGVITPVDITDLEGNYPLPNGSTLSFLSDGVMVSTPGSNSFDATLSFPYSGSGTIWYFNPELGAWQPVGGVVENGQISVDISAPGLYALLG